MIQKISASQFGFMCLMNSLDLKADPLSIALKAVQLYAETHPRPPHVTQKQAALMMGVSTATVSRLVRSGHLSLNNVGLIPIHEIDNAIQKAA